FTGAEAGADGEAVADGENIVDDGGGLVGDEVAVFVGGERDAGGARAEGDGGVEDGQRRGDLAQAGAGAERGEGAEGGGADHAGLAGGAPAEDADGAEGTLVGVGGAFGEGRERGRHRAPGIGHQGEEGEVETTSIVSLPSMGTRETRALVVAPSSRLEVARA